MSVSSSVMCESSEAERLRRLRLAEDARRSEQVWNILVPERNWSLGSPAFWILLLLLVSLHMYNNRREESQARENALRSEEELAMLRRAVEAREKRRQTTPLSPQDHVQEAKES